MSITESNEMQIKDLCLEINDNDCNKIATIAIHLEEEGDVIGAISLYKFGVHLNDVICMTRLANLLSEPPAFLNIPLAEELYKRACIAGHAPSCRNLAILYKQLGRTAMCERYMRLARARGDIWQLED